MNGAFIDYAVHPLGLCPVNFHERLACRGYNLWSGIGSDIGEITLITAILVTAWRVYKLWKKHTECHIATCKNHGHVVHGTPYRACHEHDPRITHQIGEDITADHILQAYKKSVNIS